MIYPQTLLALLWITCSPLAAAPENKAVQPVDQKTISLSHGFLKSFLRISVSAKQYLSPISVGASVDKVFAIRSRPCSTSLSKVWLKSDQAHRETVIPDKSRIFFGFCGESYAPVHSCPHLLWVEMWITCSRKAERHAPYSAERNRSYFVQFYMEESNGGRKTSRTGPCRSEPARDGRER